VNKSKPEKTAINCRFFGGIF